MIGSSMLKMTENALDCSFLGWFGEISDLKFQRSSCKLSKKIYFALRMSLKRNPKAAPIKFRDPSNPLSSFIKKLNSFMVDSFHAFSLILQSLVLLGFMFFLALCSVTCQWTTRHKQKTGRRLRPTARSSTRHPSPKTGSILWTHPRLFGDAKT